jgi:signal transduction histidine kinase
MEKTELEVERTAALINNLLIWSRSELEGNHSIYEEVNVYDVVQQNMSYFKDHIEAKSIKCQNLADRSKTVRIEAHILNMCLRNLLSNAIKYTSKNGKIDIGYNSNNGFAEFFVSDNGTGICEDRMESLFRLSFDSKIGTDGERGSGIGLYILKDFLDNAEGYIDCSSRSGKGSAFKFGLPIKRNLNEHSIKN